MATIPSKTPIFPTCGRIVKKFVSIIELFDRVQNNRVCLVRGGQNSNNVEVRETKILQHFLKQSVIRVKGVKHIVEEACRALLASLPIANFTP